MSQPLTTAEFNREQYLRCNTVNHAWDDQPSDWNPAYGTPMLWRCIRCSAERRDVVNAFGQVVSRRYVYPPGYSYSKGERPSRSDFRMMLLAERMKENRAKRRAT